MQLERRTGARPSTASWTSGSFHLQHQEATSRGQELCLSDSQLAPVWSRHSVNVCEMNE